MPGSVGPVGGKAVLLGKRRQEGLEAAMVPLSVRLNLRIDESVAVVKTHQLKSSYLKHQLHQLKPTS